MGEGRDLQFSDDGGSGGAEGHDDNNNDNSYNMWGESQGRVVMHTGLILKMVKGN